MTNEEKMMERIEKLEDIVDKLKEGWVNCPECDELKDDIELRDIPQNDKPSKMCEDCQTSAARAW